jgi:hypothetical protein
MNGQRIVLGMGTGRCGTGSLAALLNRQPGARVTHEMRPRPRRRSRTPWRRFLELEQATSR